MKKIFNFATLYAVAILLTLSGCLSEQNRPIDGEANVFLRIDESAFGTRFTTGLEQPHQGGDFEFQTGNLYLTTPAGVIMERFIIANVGVPTPTVTRGETINRNCLSTAAGVIITNVPPNVRNGYAIIVGNTPIPFNFDPPNIEDVEERTFNITSQRDYESLNLFGRQQLTLAPPIAGVETWRANVELTSTVARFEIPNIVGMGNVVSFVVDGVFIDNFYREARINNTVVPNSLVNNIQANPPRIFDWNTSGYPSAFRGHTFHWHGAPGGNGIQSVPTPDVTINGQNLGTLPTVEPPGGSGYRWTFHLLAGTGVNPTVPRIVFRLRNVVVRDNAGNTTTLSGVRFVTFNNFVMADGITGIPGIEAGYIYYIPRYRLVFCDNDLRETPSLLSSLSRRAIPVMQKVE